MKKGHALSKLSSGTRADATGKPPFDTESQDCVKGWLSAVRCVKRPHSRRIL